MGIRSNTFVQLHGGAVVFVLKCLTRGRTFQCYNISSTSLKFGDYTVDKVQVSAIDLAVGKNLFARGRYDKNAEGRVKKVQAILQKIK